MLAQNQFSCFLIGEGTLPIQCALLLLERGYQIFGIISLDEEISNWAKERGIPYIQPTDNLREFLSQKSFDYLFSIVNSSVLPKEILSLPLKCAINYHDAPLPRYAGFNGTSWALMNQEKTHGITWHIMSELVEEEDILKQIPIDIAEGETAFTLNQKCYEAGISSFAELIDELSSNQAVSVKQNLNQRTYFPPSKRPPAGGLLEFNRCAYELDALVRALDFGCHPNPLGLAKLAIGGDFIVVSQLEILDEFSQFSPGTIIDIEPNILKVSTSSYDVALRQVMTLEGETLSIPDLVKYFELQVGYRFKEIDSELAQHIEEFDTLIAKHEPFWVKRLAKLQPITIPSAERTASCLKQERFESVKILVPDEVTSFLEERHPTWNLADFLFVAFVGYLACLGGTDCFDIGFRNAELVRELDGMTGFFADYVPSHLEINLEQSFEEFFATVREQVELTQQHKTYARDAIARHSELRSLPELVGQQMFPLVIERRKNLPDHQVTPTPGNQLTFIISEDGKESYWLYNPEALSPDSLARMQEQFLKILQGIVTDPTQSIAYLSLLSEEELYKIWEKVLGTYPVGVKDDFFDLGGHSLLALRLVAEIEKVYHKNLPLATLFQASTVEQLARIIRQKHWSAPWSSLVAIQSGGSKPPFFCCHGIYGNVVNFRELASHLGSEQPFYGLQPKGLDGKETPYTRVEDMASHYIKDIRNFQPSGPYFLGGFSFGAIVAFEIAQQLTAQGQKVALLVSFDRSGPNKLPVTLVDWLKGHLINLSKLKLKEQLNYIWSNAKWRIKEKMIELRDSLEQENIAYAPEHLRYQNVLKANLIANKNYIPQPYPGGLTLFQAETKSATSALDPQGGWGGIALGGVENHQVPGDHLSILKEPNVKILAEKLRVCIDKAINCRY